MIRMSMPGRAPAGRSARYIFVIPRIRADAGRGVSPLVGVDGRQQREAPIRRPHPMPSSDSTLRWAESVGQHGVEPGHRLHPEAAVDLGGRLPAREAPLDRARLRPGARLPLQAVRHDPEGLEAGGGLWFGLPMNPPAASLPDMDPKEEAP